MGTLRLDDLSTTAEVPYWRWLSAGEFRLPSCTTCGRWCWPAQFRCAECGGFEFQWEPLEPLGRVFSWTRTWHPFIRERADQVPYVVVVAEVPAAGGSRVLGMLADAVADVTIGQMVTGSIMAPPDDGLLPSLVWRLA